MMYGFIKLVQVNGFCSDKVFRTYFSDKIKSIAIDQFDKWYQINLDFSTYRLNQSSHVLFLF